MPYKCLRSAQRSYWWPDCLRAASEVPWSCLGAASEAPWGCRAALDLGGSVGPPAPLVPRLRWSHWWLLGGALEVPWKCSKVPLVARVSWSCLRGALKLRQSCLRGARNPSGFSGPTGGRGALEVPKRCLRGAPDAPRRRCRAQKCPPPWLRRSHRWLGCPRGAMRSYEIL